jgi:hypothetical protein
MTKDEQPQKLTEESCADFVDRLQLEALNRRWAAVVIGARSRGGQRGVRSEEVQPAQVGRSAQETRPSQAD